MTGDEPEPRRAGIAYGEFIKEQLESQAGRRKWIEEKGLGVVTSSAALTGLLFGLVTLITADKAFSMPKASVPILAFAVLAFLLAALLGVMTNWPRFYPAATTSGLEKLTSRSMWDKPEDDGQRATAKARVAIVKKSRVVNTTKAYLLVAALVAQFGGVVMVSAVVWQILAAA